MLGSFYRNVVLIRKDNEFWLEKDGKRLRRKVIGVNEDLQKSRHGMGYAVDAILSNRQLLPVERYKVRE